MIIWSVDNDVHESRFRCTIWAELVKILKQSGQVIKGVWGISRCQEAMKGVEGCDKPGEAVKRALIPGFLNYCMLNS